MTVPTALALDCTAEGLSIALQVLGNKQFTQSVTGSRTSDNLPAALQALFTESQTTAAGLSEIRLTVGPGSFTGIRLGLATAEALKLLNPTIQVRAFSTLQALASQIVAENHPTGHFHLLLDAAGGQAYFQSFNAHGHAAAPAHCLPLAEITPTPTTYAPTSLMLPHTQPLPPLNAATLFTLPEALQIPAHPVYLKPLTYKKVAE